MSPGVPQVPMPARPRLGKLEQIQRAKPQFGSLDSAGSHELTQGIRF